jgi:DNA-binding NarL/FixJ family response regulator
MIRVLIADDHALVRRGLRALIEQINNVEVVGEAVDGMEAVDLAQELLPDIVIMDVAMPRLDGIGAVKRMQQLNVPSRIVILSMYDNPDLVQKAIQEGAVGYLIKRAVSEELALAIEQVSQEKSFISRHISL